MLESGFEGIRKSITRRQNMGVYYIATRPIMDLCERYSRRPGAMVSQQWWKQASIDLEVVKERTEEAATDSESDLDPGR